MDCPRAIFLTDADAGQGSTAKIIGGFAVGESDDFILKVLLHRRSKTNAKVGECGEGRITQRGVLLFDISVNAPELTSKFSK